MKRLVTLALVFLLVLPSVPVEANPLLAIFRVFIGSSIRRAAVGGVVRGILRGGFRRLAVGGGRALIRSEINLALRVVARRRIVVHKGRERLIRLLGKRTTYTFRGAAGAITRTATVEGELLVFRQGVLRLGFAQWETEGLVLYRANGLRVVRLVEEGERILAYDSAGGYLGQFITELIEDQITQAFVDALGRRHEELVLPQARPPSALSGAERHSSFESDGSEAGFSEIRDGILYVYDSAGVAMARGLMEESQLVIYGEEGERLGHFERKGEVIIAYDANSTEVGRIVTEGDKAVYYEKGLREPQAWVDLVQPAGALGARGGGLNSGLRNKTLGVCN